MSRMPWLAMSGLAFVLTVSACRMDGAGPFDEGTAETTDPVGELEEAQPGTITGEDIEDAPPGAGRGTTE